MEKKIIAIIIALLTGGSITTAVFAQKQTISALVPPYPRQEHPELMFAEGVALDKNTQDTKQVAFLLMKYGNKENIYLIIGDQTYKMTEVTNSTNNLGPGTKVLKYRSEDGSILTILAQRFEQWGQISVSGDFKNYLITFKPIYQYDYYPGVEPMYGETRAIPTGVGKIPKEERKEFIEETRPVIRGLEEIANREGMNISDILKSQAKPISEWVD